MLYRLSLIRTHRLEGLLAFANREVKASQRERLKLPVTHSHQKELLLPWIDGNMSRDESAEVPGWYYFYRQKIGSEILKRLAYVFNRLQVLWRQDGPEANQRFERFLQWSFSRLLNLEKFR